MKLEASKDVDLKTGEPVVHDVYKWMPGKENFLQFFSEDELMNALHELCIGFRDVTKTVYQEWEKRGEGLYILVKTRTKDKEVEETVYGRVVTRTIKVTEYEYIVPAHNSTIENRLWRFLIRRRFPWFDKYIWHIYLTDRKDFEIYMHTDHISTRFGHPQSLYVPIQALMACDVEAIKRRYLGYYANYHLGIREYQNFTEDMIPKEYIKAFLAKEPKGKEKNPDWDPAKAQRFRWWLNDKLLIYRPAVQSLFTDMQEYKRLFTEEERSRMINQIVNTSIDTIPSTMLKDLAAKEMKNKLVSLTDKQLEAEYSAVVK